MCSTLAQKTAVVGQAGPPERAASFAPSVCEAAVEAGARGRNVQLVLEDLARCRVGAGRRRHTIYRCRRWIPRHPRSPSKIRWSRAELWRESQVRGETAEVRAARGAGEGRAGGEGDVDSARLWQVPLSTSRVIPRAGWPRVARCQVCYSFVLWLQSLAA